MAKTYDYNANDTIGVIKYGRWGNIMLQGLYKISKCNGNVVQITRESDGYTRTFSNRTGCEKHSYGTDSRYDSAQLVTVEYYNKLSNVRQREVEIRNTWKEIESAASKKNLADLKALVAKLETF